MPPSPASPQPHCRSMRSCPTCSPRCATARAPCSSRRPGAGKTTRVAPALLDEPWCDGQVLLLVPRRLAARAAAEYIARERGERGRRDDRLCHPPRQQGRQGDPPHRHDPRRVPRPPPGRSRTWPACRRCCSTRSTSAASTATSASRSRSTPRRRCAPTCASSPCRRRSTASASAALLGDPPRIESEGEGHPLTLVHEGRDADPADRAANGRRDPPRARRASRLAARLPPRRRRDRAHRRPRSATLPADVVLHRLHGQVDPAAQRAALAPPAPGTRKLVLASAIAETSLTLDDVAHRRRQRPRPPPALRSRRRPHPPGHRARQPRRRHPARRPRRAPAPGRRDPPVGGSRDRRAPRARPARNPRGRSVEPAADLPAVGRGRPDAPALPRSAARRRARRSARPADAARRDRRRRPAHRPRPRHRRACRSNRASPTC